MKIDVIDLEYDNLNFSRSYNQDRYKRGRNLYNRDCVTIENVEKIDSNTVSIKASVDGNYDVYTTKLQITGNVINEFSCTCEDYHKGNLCKHIIATSMEVIEPHNASTVEGQKRLDAQKKADAEKAFQLYMQRKREEEQRREYERKYYYGLQTLDLYKPNKTILSQGNTLDISSIFEKAQLTKNTAKADISTEVRLEPKLEYLDNKTLKLSFKIGQARMYVLKNLQEIYNAYKNQEELEYGKQLRFFVKKENFEEKSRDLLDYIISYGEMVEYSNKFSRYNYSDLSNKEIYLSGDKIEQILDMMPNKGIWVTSYSQGEKIYELTNEKLDMKCQLKKEMVETRTNFWDDEGEETEEYVFRLNISDYEILFSNNFIYIFYKNKIYKMEKNNELEKIFDIFSRNEEVLIPEDKIDEFKKFVLPKIKNFTDIGMFDSITQESSIVNDLASKILLDVDENGNIMLELKFCYGEYEFNILEKDYEKIVEDNNIIRDIPNESAVLKRIFEDGFVYIMYSSVLVYG